MTLWLILASMTVGTLVVLLLPLQGRRSPLASRAALELAVHRDRLAEVRRELVRGLLSPAEAEAAEAEIARRMLAIARSEQAETAAAPAAPADGTRARRALALVASVVPAGALGLYLMVGSPGEPGHPFAAGDGNANVTAEHQDTGLEVSIRRLTARLEQDPGDFEGWILLARSHAALGNHGEAAAAFRRALDLAGDRLDLAAAYAETLVAAAGGVITPEAEALFRRLSDALPAEPQPRYYLGLARVQAGDARGALDIWLALEAAAPPGAPWRATLSERIDRLAAESGIDLAALAPDRAAVSEPAIAPNGPTETGPAAAPGPTAADIAAAQALDADEQGAMIRAMVARLAERLEREPGDAEGWLRLANAYRVLGEAALAEQAVRRAAEAGVGAPPELRARIVDMARGLGVVDLPAPPDDGGALPAAPLTEP